MSFTPSRLEQRRREALLHGQNDALLGANPDRRRPHLAKFRVKTSVLTPTTHNWGIENKLVVMLTLMASMAYSTWNRRPSGEKVLTPRSYSVLPLWEKIPRENAANTKR